jgi:hypothetical protein
LSSRAHKAKTGLVRCNALRAALLILIALCFSSIAAAGCDQLAAGSSFWVRLSTPISSFTAKPGTPVKGVLLESPECDGAPVFPTKVAVEGKVLSGHRVGLGVRHETAALEFAFSRVLLPDGNAIEINGRVKLIDNARESVRNGVIHGIRATDTPQGMISSRLKYLPSIHLYPDAFLLGYKMLFPIFPEPEINLEAGTDLQVELAEAVSLPADLPAVSLIPRIEEGTDLNEKLAELPDRTYTKKGKEADVIDIVFAGSREDLEHAFTVAGWQQSKNPSGHTFFHQFYSYLSKTAYPTAPMSTQLMQGRKPDLRLEKVFQSYEKRNHVRIWDLESTWRGMPLWASAAVRETGATLSVRHGRFIHHVSEDLSEEQETIVRDLAAADCVDSVGWLTRPDMEPVLRNATGEFFRTNGAVEVIRVKACGSDSSGAGLGNARRFKPGSWAYRYLRKEILTVRSDVVRANCIYALFNLGWATVSTVRQSHSHREIAAEFRQETKLASDQRSDPTRW